MVGNDDYRLGNIPQCQAGGRWHSPKGQNRKWSRGMNSEFISGIILGAFILYLLFALAEKLC